MRDFSPCGISWMVFHYSLLWLYYADRETNFDFMHYLIFLPYDNMIVDLH